MFSVYPLWRIAMPARVDLYATPLSWFNHPTHQHRHFYHLLSPTTRLPSIYPLSSLLHTLPLSLLLAIFLPLLVYLVLFALFSPSQILSLSLFLFLFLSRHRTCVCVCVLVSTVLVVQRNPNRYIFVVPRGTRAGFREPRCGAHRDGQRRVSA